MNRMPLEDRRAQLVDAALRIAARDGVEAVTVRGVAHEAGVSLGTVHYCFEDKDDLLRAMGRSIALVASEPVRDSLAAGTDFRTIAHAAAEGLWEGLKPRRHMRLLTFEFATAGARNRALRDVAQTHLDQTYDMTQGILDKVAEAAGVTYRTDSRFLSRLVAGFIDGIEIAWLIDQDDDAAIASFHALADFVTTYVVEPGAPQEDVSQPQPAAEADPVP